MRVAGEKSMRHPSNNEIRNTAKQLIEKCPNLRDNLDIDGAASVSILIYSIFYICMSNLDT